MIFPTNGPNSYLFIFSIHFFSSRPVWSCTCPSILGLLASRQSCRVWGPWRGKLRENALHNNAASGCSWKNIPISGIGRDTASLLLRLSDRFLAYSFHCSLLDAFEELLENQTFYRIWNNVFQKICTGRHVFSWWPLWLWRFILILLLFGLVPLLFCHCILGGFLT